MRLTTKGRFAVTAMIDLALRENGGPVALAAISQRQQISLSYLEQLFGKLRRHELVESPRDLQRMVGDQPPGARIKLGIWRKGSEQNVEATLAELAAEQSQAQPEQTQPEQPQSYQFGKLGLTLSELSVADREELGIRGGLFVQKVQGLSARAGLQHGDIIIGLNQTEVTTVKGFEKALNDARGNIALLVRRGDSTLFVPLRMN